MDQRNILDHQFVAAAYAVTWVIQLGYLAFLTLKWRSEKRNANASRTRRANHRAFPGTTQRGAPKPSGITESHSLP